MGSSFHIRSRYPQNHAGQRGWFPVGWPLSPTAPSDVHHANRPATGRRCFSPYVTPSDDRLEASAFLRPHSKSRLGRSKTRKRTVGYVGQRESSKDRLVGSVPSGILRLLLGRARSESAPPGVTITNSGDRGDRGEPLGYCPKRLPTSQSPTAAILESHELTTRSIPFRVIIGESAPTAP